MTLTPEASTPLPDGGCKAAAPDAGCALASALAQTSQALLAQATATAQAFAALTEFNVRLAKVETALGQQIDAYNGFVGNLNKNLPMLNARLSNLERVSVAGQAQGQGAPQAAQKAPVPPAAPAAPDACNGAQSCGQAAAS